MEPEAHIDAERGDIGDCNNGHFKHVGPPRDEARQWPELAARVLAQGTRNRVPNCQLAQGAHHHEHGCSGNDVSEQNSGTGFLNGARGTIEQACADGRVERHEADVPGVQATVQDRSLGFMRKLSKNIFKVACATPGANVLVALQYSIVWAQ